MKIRKIIQKLDGELDTYIVVHNTSQIVKKLGIDKFPIDTLRPFVRHITSCINSAICGPISEDYHTIKRNMKLCYDIQKDKYPDKEYRELPNQIRDLYNTYNCSLSVEDQKVSVGDVECNQIFNQYDAVTQQELKSIIREIIKYRVEGMTKCANDFLQPYLPVHIQNGDDLAVASRLEDVPTSPKKRPPPTGERNADRLPCDVLPYPDGSSVKRLRGVHWADAPQDRQRST